MKKTPITIRSLLTALSLALALGCAAHAAQQARTRQRERADAPAIIHAQMYNSGFALGDDNYNAIFQASDGKVYYVLASGSYKTGAQMYSFDPATKKIQHVGDLTQAAGEAGLHAIPQGKGHSIFVESNGKLYFASHVGYYSPPTPHGQELIGQPPPGYKPYPGGHFLSYDLTTHKFQNLAKAPEGEGIISFQMDAKRERLYGITWPSGLFLRYDMRTHQLKNFGSFFKGGEKGISGKTFRVICRIMVVDPDDGSVYFTTPDGDIIQYRYSTDSIGKVPGVSLKKDVFGCLNPSELGTMGYSWRQAFWYAPDHVIYAIHGRSGYLFRFNPRSRRIDVVTRLISDETFSSGMYDKNKYGYLGMALAPDGHTIYDLTGGRPRASTGADQIHFVTYDITAGRRTDHGVLELPDGKRSFFAQSIAIGKNGTIYTISKVATSKPTGNGKRFRIDLLSFRNPLDR
ncbi:MAG: hypothetical protein ACRD2B_00140 [Terriglobia bacterium]